MTCHLSQVRQTSTSNQLMMSGQHSNLSAPSPTSASVCYPDSPHHGCLPGSERNYLQSKRLISGVVFCSKSSAVINHFREPHPIHLFWSTASFRCTGFHAVYTRCEKRHHVLTVHSSYLFVGKPPTTHSTQLLGLRDHRGMTSKRSPCA